MVVSAWRVVPIRLVVRGCSLRMVIIWILVIVSMGVGIIIALDR